MRRWLVGLCLPLAALTACGSTVSTTGGGSLVGTEADGELSLDGTTTGDPGAGSGATTSADGAGGLPGAPGGSGLPSAHGSLPPGATNSPGTAGKARGVTASTITIGIPIETGTASAAEAFGIEGAGTVEPRDIAEAVIADINKSGVLGRKIQAAFHPVDLATFFTNPDATYAAICSDYRDDRPVFAIVIPIPDPGLRTCAAKMGSPLLLVNNILATVPAAAYAAHGGNYLFGVNVLTIERLAELFIESLEQRKFHEPWNSLAGGPGVEPVKLGVIHADMDDTSALYAAYARELKKYGRQFAETVVFGGNPNDAFAATQAAVLRFKAAGITHVYGASVFFMQAAESQGYRPRYAYLPNLGMLGAANAPAAQMRGALTVGWAPARDVNAAQDPGDTPGAKRCRAVMQAAGFSMANRSSDLYNMYNYCDGMYGLRDALLAGGAPTVPALRRGYEALGGRFAPALTFQSLLGPSRHYGVDSVRDMAYDSACTCLVYTSKRNRS